MSLPDYVEAFMNSVSVKAVAVLAATVLVAHLFEVGVDWLATRKRSPE